jgi:hypothetical protein
MNFLIVYGVKNAENGQSGKVSVLMSHKIDPEIMIFGASNGEAGIIPDLMEKKLKFTAFNMSIDGTSLLQYRLLAEEFNDYSKNCKYVIFSLNPFSMENEVLPSSPNRYYAWIENKHIDNNPLLNSTKEMWRYKNIPLYGFVIYDQTFYKSSMDGWGHILGKPTLESCRKNKGWNKVNLKWGENNSLKTLQTNYNSNVSIENYQILKELIHDINKNGRKVIIVLMPVQKDLADRFVTLDPLRKTLKNLTSDSNYFFDYTNESKIVNNKTYFYNYTHLNAEGARYFTNNLIKDIKEKIIYTSN